MKGARQSTAVMALTRRMIRLSYSSRSNVMRRSLLISLLVIFSLLFTSVVYACSGLSLLQVSSMSASMDDMATEGGPCKNEKQDVCKFVRDRMLSIQPAPYKAADVQQPILLLLPIPMSIDVSKHIAFSSSSAAWKIAFHSVFKISLSLSSSVLRI